jgi:PrtD family type I secretion system ABC transporter
MLKLSALKIAAGARVKVLVASVFGLGLVTNLLLLVSPIYSMSIYDSVIPSRSVATLVSLTIIFLFILAVLAVMDILRSRLMVAVSRQIEAHLAPALAAILRRGESGLTPEAALARMADLTTIRGFVSSSRLTAFLDAPLAFFYIAVIFLLSPALGVTALISALLILAAAVATERLSHGKQKHALALRPAAAGALSQALYNGDVARAMGMRPALWGRWEGLHAAELDASSTAAETVNTATAVSRTLRLGMQSSMLCVGSYLVLHQNLPAGVMIAASIIIGRALAPVEQAIGAWRSFVSARTSWQNLRLLLASCPPGRRPLALPAPAARLEVSGLAGGPPGAPVPVIEDISFSAEGRAASGAGSGYVIGIVGPSGGGKSTFMRLLLGLWPHTAGQVRFDGAELAQWDADQLGRHIGYVPQEVMLMQGTVAENIARMAPAPSEAIVAAARAAGAHEMILRLPDGYATRIDAEGHGLSGGQRQRIALARALFGRPKFLFLDEPNANLDAEGEQELARTLRGLKQAGSIVLLISHRRRILDCTDEVLVISGGRVTRRERNPLHSAANGSSPSSPSPAVGEEEAPS